MVTPMAAPTTTTTAAADGVAGCDCGITVPHKVFVTAPPGWGSLVPCTPQARVTGIRVTVEADGTTRRLDGFPIR